MCLHGLGVAIRTAPASVMEMSISAIMHLGESYYTLIYYILYFIIHL